MEETTTHRGGGKFRFRNLVQEMLKLHRPHIPTNSTSTTTPPVNQSGDRSHLVTLFCVTVVGLAFVMIAVIVLLALWYVGKLARNKSTRSAGTRNNKIPRNRKSIVRNNRFRRSGSSKRNNRNGRRTSPKDAAPPIYVLGEGGGIRNEVFEMSPQTSAPTWVRDYNVRSSIRTTAERGPLENNQLIGGGGGGRRFVTSTSLVISPAYSPGKGVLLNPDRPSWDSGRYSGSADSSAFNTTDRNKMVAATGSLNSSRMDTRRNKGIGASSTRGRYKKRKSLMEALEDLASGDSSALSGYKLPYPLKQPPTPAAADSDGGGPDFDETESEIGAAPPLNGFSPHFRPTTLDHSSPNQVDASRQQQQQQLTPSRFCPYSPIPYQAPSKTIQFGAKRLPEIIIDPNLLPIQGALPQNQRLGGCGRSSSKNSLTLPVIPELHSEHPASIPPKPEIRSLGRRFSRTGSTMTASIFPTPNPSTVIKMGTPDSSSPDDVDEEWRRVVREIQDLGGH